VDAQTTLVGVHWSRALGDAWTLRHRFNASLFDQRMLNFYITGPVDPDYVDETIFNRGVQSTRRETDVYFNGVDLTGELETGPLRHTLLVGGDHLRETNEIPRLIVVEDIPELAIDVYAPTHLAAPLSLDPSLNRPLSGVVTWYGLYAQDQIELPGGWFVLAGVRYDDARTNRRRSGVQGARSHDDRVSPRAGVLWRPLDELSIYASYTENFGQPHEMDPSEPPLPPELADQWEVGVKAELGGRLSASLAWFDLTKRNIAAADEDGDTIVIGAAEAKGIEAELSGEIVPGLRVIAGYAYMPFAKVTRDSAPILDDNGDPIGSGTEPATTGNRLFAVPRHQGSVFATYAIEHGPLAGLKVGGGAVHGGNVFNDLYEEIRLPRYTLVNLHASWAFALRGLSATAQLNVENLTDRRYFNYGAQFGPPRSAMASLRVEF
jgi:iron complex outermembrane receptor protein